MEDENIYLSKIFKSIDQNLILDLLCLDDRYEERKRSACAGVDISLCSHEAAPFSCVYREAG